MTDEHAELRELAEAARFNSDATWRVQLFNGDLRVIDTEDGEVMAHVPEYDQVAAFIAAANPTAVLGLLDEVERLWATVERVRALAEPMGAYMPYAVQLDDDVVFAVGLDDLRAALEPPTEETPCPS